MARRVLTETQKQIVRAWQVLGPGLPASEYADHIREQGHEPPTAQYIRRWVRACESKPGHTVRVRNGRFERVKLPHRSMSDGNPKCAVRHAVSRAEQAQRRADAQRAITKSLRGSDASSFAKLIAEMFADDGLLFDVATCGEVEVEGRQVSLRPEHIETIQRARHVATAI